MKLVGLVFLGLIASGAVYLLIGFGIARIFPAMDENVLMLGAFLILMPVSFFIGSLLTGYFSYYEIEDKWALLILPPALYIFLIWTCGGAVVFLLDAFIDVNDRGHINLRNAGIALLIGLFYYLSSLAGVAAGYFLRERIAKWYYGD
jgi:putative Mn2+ efflux pump MntP